MLNVIKKNWDKNRLLVLSGLIFTALLLVTFTYKSDDRIAKKSSAINSSNKNSDFSTLKKFLFNKIKSPFRNIDHEIVSGDTIQKILKKYDVKDTEIQTVITQYKKYANPNKLSKGNKIEIIIEKGLKKNKNSIIKFSIPISKSTTISIAKNDEKKIVSEKIITKLYKRKTLAENVITKNLYSSAVNANINPDTIIEFARIFGFEIDFQRDIRKNDYFKIVYDKYLDENGNFIKSGSILYAHMSVNGREITLYKFGDDKDYGYFDIDGKSVEKALMKTPINGARLSSPFGMRKHPILGYNKKHRQQ